MSQVCPSLSTEEEDEEEEEEESEEEEEEDEVLLTACKEGSFTVTSSHRDL